MASVAGEGTSAGGRSYPWRAPKAEFFGSGRRRMAGYAIEQRRDIGGRDGLTEQVALSFCAVIGDQIGQLPHIFDAFGRGRQAKFFCKAKDSADDHPFRHCRRDATRSLGLS
jgi:hypothetical protein